jgi:kynureninase
MKAVDLFSHNALARDYTRFQVADRLLLTGHSHQAWPDCSFEAQQQSWLDAAALVDDKWEAAFAQANAVRHGFAHLLGEPNGDLALGASTFELVVRLLSALPLRRRPRLVSTDGEYHSLRRLLDRLAEDWLEVVKVPAEPVDLLAERLASAVDDRTAAVLVSSVLFQSGRIVPGLPRVAAACARHGTQLVIDAYHHLNVVPFSLQGLESAFIIGGGYKYCQLGEGNCFLRVPPGCTLRPALTGWYAEFDAVAGAHEPGKVDYGRGANRFAGATYDPASHYRAAAVFAFFQSRGLTPELLREVSQHQVGLLCDRFDALDMNPGLLRRDRQFPLRETGGFLVLWSPRAGEVCRRLKAAGVLTDYRGEALRLGPAPYLADVQLVEAMDRLGQVCRRMELAGA